MSDLVVALDLEFNMPSRKIIQIGAALCLTKGPAVLRRFSCLVNQGKVLAPRITQLTGIRQSEADAAEPLAVAYAHFLEWLHQYHIDLPVDTMSWGAPDVEILEACIELDKAGRPIIVKEGSR